MARTDNYLKQAAQAKAYFLTYDQEALIRKLNLTHDEDYLYPVFFSQTYRLSRKTGDLARQGKHGWEDANTHGEVMALLDLICDSREDRFVSGKWKDMAQFGHTFHQNLLEERDPLAEACQERPEVFRRWCEALGGKPMPTGDIAYSIEVFDGLPLMIQLWFGDEDLPARARLLWDENALMYLKYETMYFAREVLLSRLKREMEESA